MPPVAPAIPTEATTAARLLSLVMGRLHLLEVRC